MTSIGARELLSFGILQLDHVPQTLVVVGPNGAGKTNLLRVIEVVRVAVDRAATFSQDAYRELQRYASTRRFGADPTQLSVVRLGIRLTEPWERELLVRFVRAAVASGLLRDTPTNVDASSALAWVRQHIDDAVLQPLMSGDIVIEFVDAPVGPWEISYEFEADGQRFRWVLDGMPTRGAVMRSADGRRRDISCYALGQKLDLDEERVPRHPFSLADLLPPAGEGRTLTLDSASQWEEMTREFAHAAGVFLQQTQRNSYALADVLHVVLTRGLLLLGDLRQPPRTEYLVEDVAVDPSPLDGSRIPVRLFRLKNGSGAERHRYQAIQDLFCRLTGRTFDVALAGALAGGSDGSPPGLEISVLVEQGDRDLPIEFAGAGLWEALLLAAVLPESSGLVAVLDEPARNLHPTLQSQLLTEMRSVAGQIIMTTHSPYLVSAGRNDDLTGIVRFGIENAATCARRIAITAGTPRLSKELSESADARGLLFARGVVLVEGGTELGAFPEWFAKSPTAQRHGTPDALNLVVFSADGDKGFGTFVGFLHALGVPWAIVCDGAVYQFGVGGRQIFEQVLHAGIHDDGLQRTVSLAATGQTQEFGELRDTGAQRGIFSLASSWDPEAESFEAFVGTVAGGQLSEAARLVGRSKPRQGRHVAIATACPREVDALYCELLRHFGIT